MADLSSKFSRIDEHHVLVVLLAHVEIISLQHVVPILLSKHDSYAPLSGPRGTTFWLFKHNYIGSTSIYLSLDTFCQIFAPLPQQVSKFCLPIFLNIIIG